MKQILALSLASPTMGTHKFAERVISGIHQRPASIKCVPYRTAEIALLFLGQIPCSLSQPIEVRLYLFFIIVFMFTHMIPGANRKGTRKNRLN